MTDERKDCDCKVCQSYCKHVPGWFLPHEIDAAAKLLGMEPLAFFRKHLTVDAWVGDTAFTLRPRTTAETGGDMSPYDPRGQCSFFRDGKCAIHAAKPHECAVITHEGMDSTLHSRTADAWRPHQAHIAELLGREPKEPEGNPFSLMGFGF